LHFPRNSVALDRRRFLTGAVASLPVLLQSSARAQDAAPTPIPIRVQTPDLAFVDALETQLSVFQASHGNHGLLLSIVPAEPASDSLLNDLRLNGRRFSGAFVPCWSIPDLVRDDFIAPASPPPAPLPPAIAQLRSYGGEWVATDFDHDCDLLYIRLDMLERAASSIPDTWDDLLGVLDSTELRIALPRTDAAQVVDHVIAMAASYVGEQPFWFHPDSMQPALTSDAHRRALSGWKALAQYAVDAVSTGDLWQSFVDGRAAFLVGSADAFQYFLDAALDPAVIGVSRLPGVRLNDGQVRNVGNTTGANWGGVAIAGLAGAELATEFLGSLAAPDAQNALWTDRQSGVIPAVVDAAASLETAVVSGWPNEPTASWLTALWETQNDPLQLEPLRIAETVRYLQALELRIVAFLEGDVATAAEALELAEGDWNAINEAIDIEIQRDLFVRSMMPPPTA
jgi:ABC-type glycerol-3-phosphate transport system substrate-binding protein